MHSGLAPWLDGSVAAREMRWTYNAYGQILTAKGPRSDVNDTTSYAYYASTTATSSLGDLGSITNPAGQVTQFATYDKVGNVLHMVAANGIATDQTYDARHRLLTTTSGGLQTSYGYDSVGQLTSVTSPNATQVHFTYDGAHRLTGVTDSAGNSVTYTLDNAGNRTQDQIKDPNGTLRRTVARSFDALGRVQQVVGTAQ